ncbi:MAG: hypothetical protein IMF17_02275 [Proteobacteria bacterium]|nr:hypothetical protein [Pseudomonadota bacterium]
MKQISIVKPALKLALVGVTGLLVACGSSGSSTPVDATISGTIVAAPVNGADVSVVDGTGVNEVVAAVKTDANGKYSLVIPNGSLGQDLIVKSTGGTFTDEATKNSGTAGALYAYTSSGSLSNGSMVSATPGSTIIAELVMNHGKTKAEAEAAFAEAFGYTPDMSVNPADATTAPAADETDAETLAGFRAGAFSQLAMDLLLSQDDQFALFAALAQDLSDDKLDGVDASGAVAIGTTGKSLEADIQNRFSTALINFRNNPNNLTGLDNNEFGDIPFAKVAFSSKSAGGTVTSSYQLEYIQTGMMAPVNGKDTFQIKVTNRSDDQIVSGLSPTLVPTMHMLAGHSHRTPMPTPAISEVGTTGVYTVTLYYLMPTAMGGYWDLNFTVNGEEAHFYPTVMMAMEGTDTPQVRLKGVDDQISMMGSMVSRTYFIFKESLTTPDMGASFDFSVFIATQESMMVFPAVYDNQTVDGNLIDATVEISDNDGANWTGATDGGNGVWSVTGLTLSDGVEDEIRIRLTIDDTVRVEAKTIDGTVGGNDYQTFKVTPGGM